MIAGTRVDGSVRSAVKRFTHTCKVITDTHISSQASPLCIYKHIC